MKRKTNLFYNGLSDDSKFLTFSNYAESLTGNFLSTDTCLFPSTFICAYMNIPNKDDLVKNYLVARYENKLAYLRDYYGKNQEGNIYPLRYLVDVLKEYDPDIRFVLADNITEQDYNGTFTDTICLVDTENFNAISYVDHIDSKNLVNYSDDNYLYGWSYTYNGTSIYDGPSEYESVQPRFDEDRKYNALGYNGDIHLTKSNTTDVEFNVVIPLYDVVNANEQNSYIYETIGETIESSEYTKNVPMGMWFSGNHSVKLYGDQGGVTWSLVVGSQFKPFPASSYMPDEISKDAVADSFATFSQVLSRQNKMIELLEQCAYNGRKEEDDPTPPTSYDSIWMVASRTSAYVRNSESIVNGSYCVSTGYKNMIGNTNYQNSYDNPLILHYINSIANDADANYSFTTGYMTNANTPCSTVEGCGSMTINNGHINWCDGRYAHVEGLLGTGGGTASHVEGRGNVTNNPSEHAEGQFNVSHMATDFDPHATLTFGDPQNTIHSIGIGTESPDLHFSNSKNAVEVMQNGDIYAYGIGNYNGRDIETAYTLQETINSLIDEVNSLRQELNELKG